MNITRYHVHGSESAASLWQTLQVDSSTETSLRSGLLVEDDPVFRESLARVFTKLDTSWSLTSVDMAAPAVHWIRTCKYPPDLVLVDIGLPDMSGIEVIRATRQRFPDVPVMVVSVIAKETTLLEAIRAGANGYLLKGESVASLRRSIEDVLAGNYPISPALARFLFKVVGAPHETDSGTVSHLLSGREIELLKLLAEGLSYIECAQRMGVALSTVQSHVRNMYRKLEVKTQMQAVSKARKFGVL